MAQGAERELVRLVNVVHQEDQALRPREVGDHLCKRSVKARQRRLRRERGGRPHPEAVGEAPHTGVVRREDRGLHAEEALGLTGASLAAAIGDRLEHAAEALERLASITRRRAVASDHPMAELPGAASHLLQEPRLPGPSFSAEEHHATTVLAQASDRLVDRRDDLLPSRECGTVQVGARRRTGQRLVRRSQRQQRVRDVVRVAQPLPRILREQPQHHVIDAWIQVLTEYRRRDRRLGHVHQEHLHRALGQERWPPREELVEDAAERVEVGARVEELASRLLRRHVERRAGDLAHHLHRLPELCVECLARQPEVHDHGHAVRRHEDVVGLQVAVQDPLAVEVGERRAQAPHDRQDPRPRLRRRGRSQQRLSWP
ncbi:MAG: hypothetical protein U0166_18815 [Acidobacteriota bacterium]